MRKTISFLAPYPFTQAPSQRFRFEQYFDLLKKNGFEISEYAFLDDKGWASLYKEGSILKKAFAMLRSFMRRFILLFKLNDADFVFIHREASMIGPPVFEWIIAKILRKKFIYDFDDAIWLPNYSESNAKFHKLKAYGKVKKIIKWADHVVVGNEYLKEYALQFNSNVSVIPTTIDLVNVHNIQTEHREKVVIGWTGTHTTAKYLAQIIPIIEKLEQEFDFEFRVISNHPPELKLKSLRYVEWNKKTEIQDLAKINIGIMPMEDSKWSRGKCGFKGLQYMALNIPALMSPVGVNSEIVEHGVNGFICDTPESWESTLRKLITDIELRKKIGDKGNKTVQERYSVRANSKNYLNLFKS
ncbi:MAG: glycosyltransferase family 4 protein [Crocinitomicaceae bacterium]|nr:glycosyltransferase family 4 protein [Crocinitomicaceae bacterium]